MIWNTYIHTYIHTSCYAVDDDLTWGETKDMDFVSAKIKVMRVWIDDVLEVRIEKMKLKIEDLFLVTNAPAGEEGDKYIDTKYGRLLCFFSSSCPDGNSYILHRSKYKYPSKNNPFSTQGDLPIKEPKRDPGDTPNSVN